MAGRGRCGAGARGSGERPPPRGAPGGWPRAAGGTRVAGGGGGDGNLFWVVEGNHPRLHLLAK